MKAFLIFLAMAFATSSHADACKKSYSDQDSPGILHSRTCSLQWSDKKGAHGAEVIFMVKGCQKYEGSEAQDCYMVRTCPADPEDIKFSSAPLFDDPAELNHYCTFTKPQLRILLGADDETPKSPVVATINCEKMVAVSITLKSPDKKTKVCHFR